MKIDWQKYYNASTKFRINLRKGGYEMHMWKVKEQSLGKCEGVEEKLMQLCLAWGVNYGMDNVMRCMKC